MRNSCFHGSGVVVGLALALLGGAETGCAPWQGRDTAVQEFRQADAATGAEYYLYVPGNYSPQRAWPLVVTLHARGGFDSAKAQVREWKALAEERGFLVLAPSLSSPPGLLPMTRSTRMKKLQADEQRVLSSLAAVKQRYRIEQDSVLITGSSGGGHPLYYIALRNSGLFNALIARGCSFDARTVESIPITDQARELPMLILYAKTGINPIYSKWNPVVRQSWAAFRYLRQDGRCFKVRIDAVDGGHRRRSELAYRFWRKHLPESR